MKTEELLHHIEIIQSFEPIKDIAFLHYIFGIVCTVLIIGCMTCQIIPVLKTQIQNKVIYAMLFVFAVIIAVDIKNLFITDYHQEWSQLEGYSSIIQVSDFLNGSEDKKKMSYNYANELISKGNKLIKEAEALKVKMALIETSE